MAMAEEMDSRGGMAVPVAAEVVVWTVVTGVKPVPAGGVTPPGGGGGGVAPAGAPVVVVVVPVGGDAGGDPVVVAAEEVEEVVPGGGGGGSCLRLRWSLRRTWWSAARAVVSCSAERKATVLSFMTKESERGRAGQQKGRKKKKCHFIRSSTTYIPIHHPTLP